MSLAPDMNDNASAASPSEPRAPLATVSSSPNSEILPNGNVDHSDVGEFGSWTTTCQLIVMPASASLSAAQSTSPPPPPPDAAVVSVAPPEESPDPDVGAGAGEPDVELTVVFDDSPAA